MTVNPARYTPNLWDKNWKLPRCVVCGTGENRTELDKPVSNMDDALCEKHSDTEFTDE